MQPNREFPQWGLEKIILKYTGILDLWQKGKIGI